MSRIERQQLILGPIAALLLLAGGLNIVGGLAGFIRCGAFAQSADIFAGVRMVFTRDPEAFASADGCRVDPTLGQVLGIITIVLAAAAITVAIVWWLRYRQSDAWFIRDVRARPGFATAGELRKHLSAGAVLRRANILRPTLKQARPTDVGWKIGSAKGLDVYVSIEDSIALEGAPRSGKGYRILISAILDWAGPLVTTSTTNDNLTATLRRRQEVGRVTVFDPQRLSGIESRLRISPVTGCDDPLVADQRAQSIIAGSALGASNNNKEWAGVASQILSRLLHAAAVSNGGVDDLYAWGTSPGQARAAVNILRTSGAAGWGDELDGILSGDPKLLSQSWFGVTGAVKPLAIPGIREALSPNPYERFDVSEFLAGENTLYLIGTRQGAGAMGGYLGAILDDVVETARRKALATQGSRLDPPLGLILDEIVNMFSWPALPTIMADGGGRGICTLVVLQALSQAQTAWSKSEADDVWSAATAKVLLGGASDVAHLRDVEALLGSRTQRRSNSSYSESSGASTSEHQERLPLMSVDEIRRMPPSVGLLSYRNRRGVLLDLRGWTERADVKAIAAGKSDVEREQRETFARQLRVPTPQAAPETAREDDD